MVNIVFRNGIQRRRRLVQNEDGPVLIKRSRQHQPLGLATGELYAVQIHLPAKVGIHPLGEFGNGLRQASLCKAVIDFYSVNMLGGLGNTFRNGGIQNGKTLKHGGKQAVIRAAVKFTNILPV